MSEYKVGQRVKVEYEGEITSLKSFNSCMRIRTEKGYSHYVCVLSDENSGVKITPSDPAGWPPQMGDIWEADGREYFAVVRDDFGGPAIMAFYNSDIWWSSVNLAAFTALNPTLVRRRGQ